MVSIIVPALNEAARIAATLRALAALPGAKEILVADGGSDDATAKIARSLGVPVIACERGRGHQMHAAACASHGDALWFIHADTIPEPGALSQIEKALRDPRIAGGNCALVFEGAGFAARQMTSIYPYLRLLGLSYGDSGIFVKRSVYEAIGGCRPYPLFEDLDLVRRIRQCGQFIHLDARICTSSRRFNGPAHSYLGAWAAWIILQVLYWLGVSPHRLARWYRHAR